MKKLLPLIALALCGCAGFRTTQIDYSYENGKLVRKIKTKASANTFFEAKSSLATWKATQTDKSQGATVGGLSQEATGSNVVSMAEAIARGVAEGAAKGLK